MRVVSEHDEGFKGSSWLVGAVLAVYRPCFFLLFYIPMCGGDWLVV